MAASRELESVREGVGSRFSPSDLGLFLMDQAGEKRLPTPLPDRLLAPKTSTVAQRLFPYATTGSVVLGLGLRLFHYLRCPSVWHDEAALMVNILEKGFGVLLGP